MGSGDGYIEVGTGDAAVIVAILSDWLVRKNAPNVSRIRDGIAKSLTSPKRRGVIKTDVIAGELGEQIGTAELSALTGWGFRRIQRNKSRLGGVVIGGRLVFHRDIVERLL